MIYEINGHRLDVYGEMNVPWSEDKISLIDYVARLAIGEEIRLVVYRTGQRKELAVKFSQVELPPIRKIYPGYETVDYEVYAGMVVMQLTANHIQGMKKSIPGLARYAELKNQKHPVLIITHVFPTSELFKARSVTMGSTMNEVNGVLVHTLDDFRRVIKEQVHNKFLTFLLSDNLTMTTDNLFVVLPMDKILAEEVQLSREYHYPISQTVKDILHARGLAGQQLVS